MCLVEKERKVGKSSSEIEASSKRADQCREDSRKATISQRNNKCRGQQTIWRSGEGIMSGLVGRVVEVMSINMEQQRRSGALSSCGRLDCQLIFFMRRKIMFVVGGCDGYKAGSVFLQTPALQYCGVGLW